MAKQFATIDDYLTALPPERREQVDALRALVGEAVPGAVEVVKWNAPTFTVDGEYRFTVHAVGRGPVRLILHCGAVRPERKGAAPSFAADGQGLLTWHSDIRASLALPDASELDSRREAVIDVIRAWAAQA